MQILRNPLPNILKCNGLVFKKLYFRPPLTKNKKYYLYWKLLMVKFFEHYSIIFKNILVGGVYKIFLDPTTKIKNYYS